MTEKPIDEMVLGQKAIREGRITPGQLNDCLAVCSRIEAEGLRPPGVLQVAREKGFLGADDLTALYGEALPRRPKAPPPSAQKRSFRARAAEAERRWAKRTVGILIFFALAAAVGAVVIEFLLR